MSENSAYQWQGINNKGRRVNGVIEASNIKDAQAELKKMDIEIIDLQPKTLTKKSVGFYFKKAKKIKTLEILLFTRFLSTMISAGLPIVKALEIIAFDQENPAMKNLILSIKSNVEGGKSLAESFSQYPKQFGNLYCNLIKAGENSGTLDKILNRLAHYMERTDKLKRKIKKALTYPAAILVVAFIVSAVLLFFVVPQFEKMFQTFGAQLPLFTRLVVNFSNFLRSYWWLVLVVAIFGIAGLKKAMHKSETVQKLIDKWSLKIYIIGPLIRNGIIARYTRTLATTLEAGMPIVESMHSISAIMDNRVYSNAILQISDEVVNGYQLSSSMRTTELFPNMVIQMIAVGENSGTLSTMLNKVADYYEEEVNSTVDNLSSLLEPLIMLVLGVIVGGFVVAMYLPIFKIGSLF